LNFETEGKAGSEADGLGVRRRSDGAGAVNTFPVRRNTLLLSATLTCLSGMLQLASAVATTTLVLVSGIEGILGLGPAIFLAAGALAALPAGRAMDRHGRIPILALGCVAGIAGTSTTALACLWDSSALLILGFALVGASMGTVLLARAAAADMVVAARRPRQISLVLFGAVAGAVLGPFVFGPMFSGHLDTRELVAPWFAAGGFMAVALVLVLLVRPDPRTIATELGAADPPPPSNVRLIELIRRPGVPTSLLAAVASFGVMVEVMNLTGYIMIGHHHEQSEVFPIISVHILGMYGLILFVGDLIERMGRRNALVAGLAVMAVSTLSLVWARSLPATGVALFGLGLGWSFAYVSATSQLVDLTAPSERGRLIGFSDLLSGFTGAALALLGGAVYSAQGVTSLAAGSTVAVVLPALWILLVRRRGRGTPALEPAG
jgi:MFS family permease